MEEDKEDKEIMSMEAKEGVGSVRGQKRA